MPSVKIVSHSVRRKTDVNYKPGLTNSTERKEWISKLRLASGSTPLKGLHAIDELFKLLSLVSVPFS
jgi:hypothetical protein